MICTACRCPAPLSTSGLCCECRAIAHRPNGRRRRPLCDAQRWLLPHYRDLRLARGMNPGQAIAKSESIFRELRLIFPIRTIRQWGLDNPYMATHARRTLVSYILRGAGKFNKKPVQSARPIATRKATAA